MFGLEESSNGLRKPTEQEFIISKGHAFLYLQLLKEMGFSSSRIIFEDEIHKHSPHTGEDILDVSFHPWFSFH